MMIPPTPVISEPLRQQPFPSGKHDLFDDCKNRAVLAGLVIGALVLAGCALSTYLVFHFGWLPFLQSGGGRRLAGHWRRFSVISLGLAIAGSSAIAFLLGSYWLALGLFIGGTALAVGTNLLRFRGTERQ
jgi:hypothetical protein